MKRINVMHLRSNYVREGGPEQFILSLAQELDRLKFDMVVVSLKRQHVPDSQYLVEARKLGVDVITFQWSKFRIFSVVRDIIQLVRRYDVHILHTHDVRTDYIGWAVGKLAGTAIVTGTHGWIKTSSFKIRLHEILDKLIIRFFDRIVVGSEEMQKEIVRLRIPPEKVATVNYAVKAERFRTNIDAQKIRKQFNLNSNGPIVGTVGRLSEEKGHRFLLQAAQRVIDAFPATKFLIVGEGPLKERLEVLAQKLGLFQNAIFTGFYDDLPQALAVMDIFVSASLGETGPITVLEAMATGKPVVATKVGLSQEAVRDGKTGFLVAPADSEALSEAILTLLRDTGKARVMGSAGQKLVKAQFSTMQMVKKMENVYLNLC